MISQRNEDEDWDESLTPVGNVARCEQEAAGDQLAAALARAERLEGAAHRSVRLILEADVGERNWPEAAANVRFLLTSALGGIDGAEQAVENVEIATLRAELALARADVEAAAAGFSFPFPRPGTDMARVMIASQMKGRERDAMWKERDEARAERDRCIEALTALADEPVSKVRALLKREVAASEDLAACRATLRELAEAAKEYLRNGGDVLRIELETALALAAKTDDTKGE